MYTKYTVNTKKILDSIYTKCTQLIKIYFNTKYTVKTKCTANTNTLLNQNILLIELEKQIPEILGQRH